MAYTNTTNELKLPQWEPEDRPKRKDFNEGFLKTEEGYLALKNQKMDKALQAAAFHFPVFTQDGGLTDSGLGQEAFAQVQQKVQALEEGKLDKTSFPTGNLAAFGAGGALADSGLPAKWAAQFFAPVRLEILGGWAAIPNASPSPTAVKMGNLVFLYGYIKSGTCTKNTPILSLPKGYGGSFKVLGYLLAGTNNLKPIQFQANPTYLAVDNNYDAPEGKYLFHTMYYTNA